jgi:hypothetical protein
MNESEQLIEPGELTRGLVVGMGAALLGSRPRVSRVAADGLSDQHKYEVRFLAQHIGRNPRLVTQAFLKAHAGQYESELAISAWQPHVEKVLRDA